MSEDLDMIKALIAAKTKELLELGKDEPGDKRWRKEEFGAVLCVLATLREN